FLRLVRNHASHGLHPTPRVRVLATLDCLGHHRRRRLADRAGMAVPGYVFDGRARLIETDGDHQVVAAHGVRAARGGVGALDLALVARVLVVLQDDVVVERVGGHGRTAGYAPVASGRSMARRKTCFTRSNPRESAVMSSGVL